MLSDNPGVTLRRLSLPTTPPRVVRVAEIPAAGARAVDGPAILVVPGWLGDIERFLAFGRELSRIGRVVIWEPHGFGGSTAPHRRGLFDAASYVAEMEHLVPALGLSHRRFVIVGSSSGATLALQYHLDGRGPQPLALALLSPQLSFRIPAWLELIDALPATAARAVQGLLLRLLRGYLHLASPADAANVDYAAEQLRRSDDWTQRRFLFEYMARCDLAPRTGAISVPVLAFAGERDWFAAHPDPDLLRVAGSRLRIVASAAHRFQEGREGEIAGQLAEDLAALPADQGPVFTKNQISSKGLV